MTMQTFWMITRFVTLTFAVGVVIALLAMWRDSLRLRAVHRRKLEADIAEAVAWFKAEQDKKPWQQAVNETLANDMRQLKVYRRHHATRLAELEDLVDLLNQDRSTDTFQYGQTVQGRVRAQTLDEPLQMEVTEFNPLEHTQPLDVLDMNLTHHENQY